MFSAISRPSVEESLQSSFRRLGRLSRSHDSTQALALLDALPLLQGPRGRPRCRPDSLLGDRANDAEHIRRALRGRHILPWLAFRNTKHGSGLGQWRWLVERTFAWLNQFRRLRIRCEKRPDMHLAFLTLACILICWKFLQAQSPVLVSSL